VNDDVTEFDFLDFAAQPVACREGHGGSIRASCGKVYRNPY
jgi:hypothetical protein